VSIKITSKLELGVNDNLFWNKEQFKNWPKTKQLQLIVLLVETVCGRKGRTEETYKRYIQMRQRRRIVYEDGRGEGGNGGGIGWRYSAAKSTAATLQHPVVQESHYATEWRPPHTYSTVSASHTWHISILHSFPPLPLQFPSPSSPSEKKGVAKPM